LSVTGVRFSLRVFMSLTANLLDSSAGRREKT